LISVSHSWARAAIKGRALTSICPSEVFHRTEGRCTLGKCTCVFLISKALTTMHKSLQSTEWCRSSLVILMKHRQ